MPLITNFAAASARAFGLGASSRYTLTSGNYSFFDTGTGVNYDITGFNSTKDRWDNALYLYNNLYLLILQTKQS